MNEKYINRIITTMITLIILVSVTGCSGGNPTDPDMSPTPNLHAESMLYANEYSNRHLWGLWQCEFDIRNESFEIVPLRDGLAHVNVIRLLEPAPLVYLRIDNSTIEVDIATGTVDVDIILEHPLPDAPEYTGFDVRGIFISNGSLNGLSIDDSLVMSASNESKLLNADGYTRWWNPSEFTGQGLLGYKDGKIGKSYSAVGYTSTLNGYKYFADGLSADGDIMQPLVLANRGRFSSLSENRRHYTIRFGPAVSDFMVFNYAVDTSWESPANVPPQSIDDFPNSANSLEPFHITIEEEINSLYFDPELIDCPTSGGLIRLNIEVASWQGVDGIAEVYVGSPEIGADFVEANKIDEYELYDSYVAVYTVELTADDINTYEPQIIAAAYTDLGNYKTGPEGLGIPFDGPQDARLAEFNTYTASVSVNSPPVVGAVTGPTSVVAGEYLMYEVDEWYDCQDLNEDLIFSWEIGNDQPAEYNDGMGTTTGLFPGGSGSIEINFPDAGIYYVDTRLTDLAGTHGYSEQPLEVQVGIPTIPAFPSEGVNLELSLKRSIIYSYEYSNNPSDIPEIFLEWDGVFVTGVVSEWVIYRDSDPYDGLEEWVEIAATPNMFYSNQLTGINKYNSGGSYYYKVTARSIPGNPASESLESTEWAFIEFENAEPEGSSMDQFPWTMGYGGYEASYYRQWERPSYGGAVAGACWMMDPDSSYMRRHQWSVIASDELPILTDPVLAQTTEEWYIELIFGGQVIPMNEMWDNYARMSVGTVPDSPSDHNLDSTYTGYDESVPGNYMAGTEYYTQNYWSSNNSRFDETSATFTDRYGWGKNEYGWPFNFARFRLTDLDPNGTGRVRAAIGFGSGATTDTRSRPRADEIAVIIY